MTELISFPERSPNRMFETEAKNTNFKRHEIPKLDSHFLGVTNLKLWIDPRKVIQ